MTALNRNELWARVLLDELARCGVRDVVVAPGSRSAPLVLAAVENERIATTVQVDERSAAFMALGVGKATGKPAAVVTTSGSAVANLFPAVVEAARSETPLILLTADRPARLRGADANQVIDQVRIFGAYARLFADLSPAQLTEATLRYLRSVVCRATSEAIGDPAGPVHLNVAFDAPLEPVAVPGDLPEELAAGRTLGSRGRPGGVPWTKTRPTRAGPTDEDLRAIGEALRGASRPLFVGGVAPRPWETGPVLRAAAERLGVPLLADPLSGARFPMAESVVVGAYDLALRSPDVARRLRPDMIVRVGSAPTSSPLGEWLATLDGCRHMVVDGGAVWKDHAAAATDVIRADPAALLTAVTEVLEAIGPPEWRAAWCRVERGVEGALAAALDATPFEGALAAQVGASVGPDDLLFVSGSLAVREIDTFLPRREEPLVVLGNRGASGIDGIVSTAAGVSLATGRRVVALLGDLALLHDSNGVAALREPRARVTLVVINNDGGGIFHLLPIRDHEPVFTSHFVTPQGRDLSHLAALHGVPYLRVEGRSEGRGASAELYGREGLDVALARMAELDGSGMLEITTDRDENQRRRDEVFARVASAASDALNSEDG